MDWPSAFRELGWCRSDSADFREQQEDSYHDSHEESNKYLCVMPFHRIQLRHESSSIAIGANTLGRSSTTLLGVKSATVGVEASVSVRDIGEDEVGLLLPGSFATVE